MKPTYDSNYTKQDEINEDRVASLISDKWKCYMLRQGHYDSFDYIAMRGDDIVSFIEMRSRSHDYGTFKDCFISLTKFFIILFSSSFFSLTKLNHYSGQMN